MYQEAFLSAPRASPPPVPCVPHFPRLHLKTLPPPLQAKLPTHVEIAADKYGVVKDSVILLEQVRTIDKSRLKEKVCHLDQEILKRIDHALCVSFALDT